VEPAALGGKPAEQLGWFLVVAGLSPVALDLGKRNRVGSWTLRDDRDAACDRSGERRFSGTREFLDLESRCALPGMFDKLFGSL
jgi:hypothetical protein